MESKKKLLIADADESFRSILMDAMRDEADMEVLAATGDGEEALRLVRELSPDVLLMDMVLARMDGLEVLSALEQASRPKVLVLSGFVRGNMAELAAAKGASYFMMKPCKLSAVIERVRQLGGAVCTRVWRAPSLPSSTRSECRPISRAISICGKPSS